MFAVPGDRLVQEVLIAQRRGAEHHPRRAGVEHGLDRFRAAQASAHLHGHIHLTHDPPYVFEVHRVATAGAVEVDDVQRPGARLHPAPGRVQRIGVVDRRLIELPPRQPHRLALENVDRRQQDHVRSAAAGCAGAASERHSATKPSSIRSPCAEDFSG